LVFASERHFESFLAVTFPGNLTAGKQAESSKKFMTINELLIFKINDIDHLQLS
jgi:hypothetical protein